MTGSNGCLNVGLALEVSECAKQETDGFCLMRDGIFNLFLDLEVRSRLKSPFNILSIFNTRGTQHGDSGPAWEAPVCRLSWRLLGLPESDVSV